MKKGKLRKILVLGMVMAAGLVAVVPAYAQDWASLKESFRKIQSVKAEFLQERHLQILKDPLVSEGRFFYLASGSLRWEYLSPLRSVMLQKGDSVRLYHFSEGAWKQDMAQGVEARRMVLAEMSQWFQGRFEESRVFKHSYSQSPPGRILLTPGEGINKFILGIEIVLADRPGVIDRVEITEPGGSSTRIVFKNVEINASLDSKVFDEP
ncbi:MAG TPA: outer membrane lipoprotein carrier protein LolA [Desulfatiglandales bacterium]|nr:outer membrane lipoprotein carrier protein LolA [Desulfatiglandales bacterium]